jgi:hypothetical protein
MPFILRGPISGERITNRNYRLYVARLICPTFPKGIYVYRTTNAHFTQSRRDYMLF